MVRTVCLGPSLNFVHLIRTLQIVNCRLPLLWQQEPKWVSFILTSAPILCCSDSDSLGNEKRWYCSLHENKSEHSPQIYTSDCRGWFAASARSCPAWWCGPCGCCCWSSPEAPLGSASLWSSSSCLACQWPQWNPGLGHPRWNKS